MLEAKEVKDYARKCGADLVGIASMDRFEGAPKQMDPRYIFPDAKALIVFAFRIPRGYFRGVEEGTYFTAYPSMGYAAINMIYAPTVLREVTCFLEDRGYETVPYPNDYAGSYADIDNGGKPHKGWWSRPVSPDKPAPDVLIQFRIAAFAAGLGEVGYSKMFLTPEFGPRQRFALCLTDAPLEPDPIYDGPPICDRCMLCAEDCSAKALSKTETVKVKVAGRTLEWGKLDIFKCSIGYLGGINESSPFLPPGTDENQYNKVWAGGGKLDKILKFRSAGVGPHYSAIEGGKGCIRACMIHLEKEGRIKNVFKNPFRKRKPWILH